VVVTISNLYGSGGLAVGQQAATALGYEFIDRQLPVVVAKRLSITTEQAEAADEAGRSFGARLLSSLELATPEITPQPAPETFDDEFIREVQRAVREFAERGNVVIAGRASGVILGRRNDVLRVFIHAPRDWRIARVARDLQVDVKAAAVEVDRIDRARRAHVRDWYGVEMGDPEITDLSIDTSTFGIEASAELLVAAVRARS
jgi:cytidylate kinase